VLTVWETIPMGRAYRNRAARRFRSEVLASADAFLATTERARDALLLEGADPARVEVCAPGIDTARFAAARPAAAPEEHLLISPGRLVWEKGHQDVIRALALIARRGRRAPRLLVVGAGPEGARLRAHADELGVGERVEIVAGVPYAEMPGLYARASALVLMSLPRAGADLLVGTPRVFWEEQFGLVLAEAMAAGLPVLAAASGAIPEVLAGAATLVEPGDWRGLADALLAGPLAAAPGTRAAHPPALVRRYSLDGAAARLAAAYDAVLARGSVAG
jgi:glycosyltransferase involved in cell wall biosynthesis